jgi:hypothetical protein
MALNDVKTEGWKRKKKRTKETEKLQLKCIKNSFIEKYKFY